jgi:hypothetical protein
MGPDCRGGVSQLATNPGGRPVCVLRRLRRGLWLCDAG